MHEESDQEKCEIAKGYGYTDIKITHPESISYITYKCKCGNYTGTRWGRFKKNPICGNCSRRKNRGVSKDTIIAKLDESELEYIKHDYEDINGRTRVIVSFICSCDSDTLRKVKESHWDSLKKGGKCSDCGNQRRGKSNKKTYEENGDKIKEKIKNTSMKKYGTMHPC